MLKRKYVKKPDESEPWQDPGKPGCGFFSCRLVSAAEKKIKWIGQCIEKNYRLIDKMILESEFNHYRLFDKLPECFAPYLYPLRLPADKSRDVMIALTKLGIQAAPWSDLSPEVKDSPEYQIANDLRRKVITLPIHYDIKSEQIRRMAKIVISLL